MAGATGAGTRFWIKYVAYYERLGRFLPGRFCEKTFSYPVLRPLLATQLVYLDTAAILFSRLQHSLRHGRSRYGAVLLPSAP